MVLLINGLGLLAFRDPYGIRPLCFGARNGSKGVDYSVASESVAIDALDPNFKLIRDVRPGEAIFISMKGAFESLICHDSPSLNPCLFEHVYFARPDSVMDGVTVYESRLNMGARLARRIMEEMPHHDIDVVIPIPDTSRTSALQCAYSLGRPYREGFVKNRYIARTFIMPGQVGDLLNEGAFFTQLKNAGETEEDSAAEAEHDQVRVPRAERAPSRRQHCPGHDVDGAGAHG